jgi:hypothetical protein
MRQELLLRDWKDVVEITKSLVRGGTADLSDRQETLLESDAELASLVRRAASLAGQLCGGVALNQDERMLLDEDATVRELVHDVLAEIRQA